MEYKNKKFRKDNEVVTHDGTFEFVSKTDNVKESGKTDDMNVKLTHKVLNLTASKKRKEDVTNVLFHTIQETKKEKNPEENKGAAVMPKTKGGNDIKSSKKNVEK